jgi:hypothetical protein
MRDPDSEWGRDGRRELEVLDGPYQRARLGQAARRRGARLERDAPERLAVYSPFQVRRQVPEVHPDEREDTVAVFEAEAGLEFWRDEDQAAGPRSGTAATRTTTCTSSTCSIRGRAVWYDRRLGEDTWLRLQPFIGYAWLETDPFVLLGGGRSRSDTVQRSDLGRRLLA